ncbi:hypothetical protein [Paracoccus sp. S1E-3]|uniref:hypothetical protein n=1 Tax=Paracoccus sp. S1E-3 TaxID=2756130 RepID=UPI0015EF6E23|nr:hypothetical protein [Paracoccus sp. S1E-3]MBA4492029.1 hypothetical protein [Paracoccus sp. S1E-3]
MSDVNLDELLLVDDPEALTDAQIAYLRDHPELLDLIGERETLGTRHLWRILIAALILVALSKVIAARFDNAFDQVIADTLVDLVFEMGAALIGSVATVIFIEHRGKKQFIANIRFREAVQRRIGQLENRQPG